MLSLPYRRFRFPGPETRCVLRWTAWPTWTQACPCAHCAGGSGPRLCAAHALARPPSRPAGGALTAELAYSGVLRQLRACFRGAWDVPKSVVLFAGAVADPAAGLRRHCPCMVTLCAARPPRRAGRVVFRRFILGSAHPFGGRTRPSRLCWRASAPHRAAHSASPDRESPTWAVSGPYAAPAAYAPAGAVDAACRCLPWRRIERSPPAPCHRPVAHPTLERSPASCPRPPRRCACNPPVAASVSLPTTRAPTSQTRPRTTGRPSSGSWARSCPPSWRACPRCATHAGAWSSP